MKLPRSQTEDLFLMYGAPDGYTGVTNNCENSFSKKAQNLKTRL